MECQHEFNKWSIRFFSLFTIVHNEKKLSASVENLWNNKIHALCIPLGNMVALTFVRHFRSLVEISDHAMCFTTQQQFGNSKQFFVFQLSIQL